MTWYSHALWTLVFLMTPTFAWAQGSPIRFEILAGSTYTYYPSGFGFGLEDCSPNAFQCDFEITGNFSVQFDNNNGSASIVNASISLTGNEDVNGPVLTTEESVETWLENQTLLNIVSITTQAVYQGTLTSFSDPLLLTFDTPGTAGSLTGGFDGRPVDGVAIQFQANLQRVADEPVLLADCNQDGVVNFDDIAPFVSVLSTGGYLASADCNQDDSVNFLDIGPFISLLFGT